MRHTTIITTTVRADPLHWIDSLLPSGPTNKAMYVRAQPDAPVPPLRSNSGSGALFSCVPCSVSAIAARNIYRRLEVGVDSRACDHAVKRPGIKRGTGDGWPCATRRRSPPQCGRITYDGCVEIIMASGKPMRTYVTMRTVYCRTRAMPPA